MPPPTVPPPPAKARDVGEERVPVEQLDDGVVSGAQHCARVAERLHHGPATASYIYR